MVPYASLAKLIYGSVEALDLDFGETETSPS
jgi:hypothetical protein